MQAIILAAGFGTRLKPYTETLPKALVQCNGKAMIDHAIEYLSAQGFDHIIINVHHFGELIINHINTNTYNVEILISNERDQLKDTGGALVAALPLMRPEKEILIFNTDVITDLDLKKLYEVHNNSGNSASLIVQDRPSTRKLAFDENLHLTGWINYKTGDTIGSVDETKESLYAFSGIHMIDLELIRHFAVIYGSAPFPMIPAYLSALEKYSIGAFESLPENIWLETGDPDRLKLAEEYLKIDPEFRKNQIAP